MKLLGITGPTGAGKSLLCKYLSDHNVVCIDADSVYHSMLLPPSECLDALRRAFGDEVFSPDGKLDRAALGAIVFNDPQKLELLNKTVLRHVVAELRQIVADKRRRGAQAVAIDAPTLIESGLHRDCSIVVSVLAPRDARLNRIRERDSLSHEKALQRVDAQKSDDFYTAASDIVLINDGDPEGFYKKAEELLRLLKQ